MNSKVQFLHVAVAVIKNTQQQILISKRANDVHQGGLWEFPGGKIETSESVFSALKRELFEELGISITAARPLIKIKHHYQDLSVLLDVWQINDFSGSAYGKEGQKIKWLSINQLSVNDFPAANKTIITAVRLPQYYAILDDGNEVALLTKLEKVLNKSITLIQLRLKNSTALQIKQFLTQAMPLCKQHQVHLLINSGVSNSQQLNVDGLHLTSSDLMALEKRPMIRGWLAASCHNLSQLQYAEKIGVDFAVLAPVLPTQTHPNAKVLGWQLMTTLIEAVNIPVFALGGLITSDVEKVQRLGGQGIAGIRTFL
jgi:8-oxo-dGTP diphosphatase